MMDDEWTDDGWMGSSGLLSGIVQAYDQLLKSFKILWANRHHVGSLESAVMGIFTSWKSTNTTNQALLFTPEVTLPKKHH